MQLLEREAALAALAEAREAAARGDGQVVVVVGEPGIGKTTLVTRFLADLGADVRVLFGSCDDLSIPRPLGAIHDLAGTLSPALEETLAAGASPHAIHRLLLDELALPQPTVLVLEDVHWADEATLDVITLLARRIGSLPVFTSRSRCTHLAGSTYSTRVSLNDVTAAILGYATGRTFSYGV